MEEVYNAHDANFCVIISEASGLKRTVETVYFLLEEGERYGEALEWVARNYGYLFCPGMRIDCYKVVLGRKVAWR